MNPGILISTPDLRPSLLSIVEGLDKASLLKQLVTTIAINPDTKVGKWIVSLGNMLPPHWAGGLKRRIIPNFLRDKTQILYTRELVRLVTKKWGNDVLSHHVWLWAELGFDRAVARRYAGKFRCIYGIEHSSLETFIRQKNAGGLCLLRQVIAHAGRVADVMRREINKFPEYTTPYLQLLHRDMERSVSRKEAEYKLADLIVTNSRFSKNSFIEAGIAPERVVGIPTGCPSFPSIQSNAGKGNKPLVFLFVGILSLRKGLPYLIKAWQLLSPGKTAELWLAGSPQLPLNAFREQGNNIIKYFGMLTFSNLLKLYAQADIFVFPTLLEGCAHAVLEALSCGMPIITTEESGCSEFVQDSHNGFIVEAANIEALLKAMGWCLEHRNQLPNMGRVSKERARSWTVTDSTRAHLTIIQNFLKRMGAD